MDLDVLREIDHKNPLFYIFMCAATVLPGILMVFLFGRSLFLQAGTVMVLVFGLAVTVPVFLLNYMTALALKPGKTTRKRADIIDIHVVTAALVTATSLYFSLCLSWAFFSSLVAFIASCVVLEVVWVALCVHTARKMKEEEFKKSRKKRVDRSIAPLTAGTVQ